MLSLTNLPPLLYPPTTGNSLSLRGGMGLGAGLKRNKTLTKLFLGGLSVAVLVVSVGELLFAG